MKEAVHHCPACGEKSLLTISSKQFCCELCRFTFFQNPAAAAMVAICYQDELLVATRAHEPGIGMWDLPGGFVDPDESLEEAVVREVYEELNLHISGATYISSYSNTYLYKEIKYKTCDAFFVVELDEKPALTAQDDVASIEWLKLSEIDIERFAFESAKKAVLTLSGSEGVFLSK